MMRQLLRKKQKLDIVLQSSLYFIHPGSSQQTLRLKYFEKKKYLYVHRFILSYYRGKHKEVEITLWFQWLCWMCWWRWNRNSNETKWLSRFTKLPKCGKRHALSISCWHTWNSVPKKKKNVLEDIFWRNHVPIKWRTSLPSKGKARGLI